MTEKLEDGIKKASDELNDKIGKEVTERLGKDWGNFNDRWYYGCERIQDILNHHLSRLDGKPVVDEGVIEAIFSEWRKTLNPVAAGIAERILKQHLSPTQPKQGEGEIDADSPAFKRANKQLRDMLNVKRLEVAMTKLLATIDGNTNQHGIVQFSNLADSVGEARIALERAKSSAAEQEQRDAADRANAADMANLREGCVTLSNKLADVEADRDRLQARIAELEATPTANRYRENATGDEWVFLPESKYGDRVGLRLRDKQTAARTAAELESQFTFLPTPPAAEEPIVRLPGAFVCWRDGVEHSAWEAADAASLTYPMQVVNHKTRQIDLLTREAFDRHFTRTPPTQLSPELEKFVQPLVEFAGKPVAEVRQFLAERGAATNV